MKRFQEIFDAIPSGAYLEGKWVEATDAKHFEVKSPSTGEKVHQVADTSQSQWAQALESSVTAFNEWSQTTAETRSDALRKLYDVATARQEEIAAIISLESGKPFKEGLGEAKYGTSFLRWYSELIMAQRGEFELAPSGEYWMVTTKHPIGPTLLITPWNFPYAMITRKLGAALAAGCSANIKPASQTPLSAAWLVDIIHEVIDLPPGTVNYLPTTDARNISKFFMDDERLRKISFTGSTQVGSVLLRQAADNIQASSMELGGNAPFIVLPSANIDSAMEGALIAKFRNAGQACVGANRILVHESIHEEFTSRFVDSIKNMVVGAWDDEGSEIGPVIDEKQLESVEKIVKAAEDEGAEVVLGGNRIDRPGTFFEPTVITNAPIGGDLWSEEIFGPVAAIYPYGEDDNIIDLANKTEYGLVSYLYGDETDASLIDTASQIQSGMVAVNRPIISEARAPFGGVKASGLGREGGTEGLDDYQVTQYIALQR